MKGLSITGYGGIELLELACIIRAGRLSKDIDLERQNIRNRYQSGRDIFATTRFCKHCLNECMENFEGNIVIVGGLNNILHADKEPFKNWKGYNQQRSDQLLNRIDEAVSFLAPKATLIYALPLVVPSFKWAASPLQKSIFSAIMREMQKRRTLQMDNDEPRRLRQYDRYGVHMYDYDSINYWTSIFDKLDEENAEQAA